MKKILACLLVALMLVMALASCNVGGGDGTTAGGTTAEPTNAINTAGAKEFLKATLRDKATVTPADYTLQTTINFQKNVYTVTWTVEVTQGQATDVVIEAIEGNDAEVLVNVNEETETAVKYVLTATVSFEGYEPAILVMDERTVPVVDLMTWQQYIDAEAGETVCVQGVITALSSTTLGGSKKNIWLQDNDGGYYAFGLSEDPIADLGLAVGMTVKVKGTKDLYSGTHEIKDVVSVEVVDSNITNVTPADYTQIFANASSLKAEALVGKQSFLVTIKGVTVLPQDSDASTNGYYKFKMGDLETYVRISGSECPISKDDQATFKSGHAEHAGWTADVTGLVAQFDGKFYLIPVSVNAFDYKEAPSCAHEAAADWSKDGQSHWHVCALCSLSMGDNAAHTFVNNVCSACGHAPEVLTVEQAINNAANAPADAYYLITGIVDEIANTQYGNMYIKDEAGNRLYIYGFYSADGSTRFDAMGENQPKVGDIITVLSGISVYNSAPQLKNARMISCETPVGACQHTNLVSGYSKDGQKHWQVCADCEEVAGDKVAHTIVDGACSVCGYAPVAVSLPAANEIGAAKEHNDFAATVTHIVTGTILSIDPDKNDNTKQNAYGNMYIQDAEGNTLYIYGLYSADGKVRFDAMNPQPKVGDVVVVYGVLGRYNSIVQMKNAWLISCETPDAGHTHAPEADYSYDDNYHWNECECGEPVNKAAHSYVDGVCVCGAEEPAAPATMTVAEVLAADINTQVTFTGAVVGIYQAYNSDYGNISVYISDGTGKILAFRLVGEWAMNDILTITGTLVDYNGSKQIGAGCTAVKVGVHECNYSIVDVTNPTCTDGGFTTHTCPVCNDKFVDSEVDALGHTTENGTCDRCGNIIGTGAPVVESITLTMVGKQSSWDSNYVQRTVTLDIAKVVFSSANKQTQTITDRPVLAGPKSASTQYVTVTITNGKTLDGVTFNLSRWSTSKTFVKISIEYNLNGTWVEASVLTLASNGALANATEAFSADNFPAGVTEVRLAVQTTNRMQLGIGNIVVDVK